MVQPCCERTYQKYQTAPHEPNMVTVREMFGADTEHLLKTETGTEWADFIFKRHGHYPRESFLLIGGKETALCTCDCHTYNSNMMH